MNLKIEIDIIEVLYKNKVVLKIAEISNGNESQIQDLKYKKIPFELSNEEKKIAEEVGVYFYDSLNIEGLNELHRFLSYLNEVDFLKVKFFTEKITV